jgi:hypothetical protein
MALILFHFFVPFFYLLFRENKRQSRLLLGVAGAIVLMHLVDLTWLVIPSRFEALNPAPYIPWPELLLVPVATAGIGGIWVAAFLWRLKARPLVPRRALADLQPASEHAGGIR